MQILFLSSRSSRPHVNALFLVQHYWWYAGLSPVGVAAYGRLASDEGGLEMVDTERPPEEGRL